MRRILLIAPYFPPRRRVGALRPWRLATRLAAHGYRPTVLSLQATERPTAREAEALALLDHLPLEPWRRAGGLGGSGGAGPWRSSSPGHGGPEGGARRPDAAHALGRLAASWRSGARGPAAGPAWPASQLAGAIDWMSPVDTWLPLMLAALPRVLAWVDRHRPALVWSTADPWSSHVLALALAQARPSLPWVADFRDPWTLCPIRGSSRPPWVRAIDRRVEAAIVARADRLTFTARTTAERYAAAYPARAAAIAAIPNAWDARALGTLPATLPAQARPISRDGLLRITFFGRFRPLSPDGAIVGGLLALAARAPELARRIRLASVGGPAPERAAQLAAAGLAGCMLALEPVPYERALAVLGAADLLLLSTDPRRDDIIPAKLWDYLPALRPILNLAPNAEARAVVAETGVGGTWAPGDAEGIAAVLGACVRALDEGGPLPIPFAPDRAAILGYEAEATTQAQVAIFDTLVAARGRGGAR